MGRERRRTTTLLHGETYLQSGVKPSQDVNSVVGS